jgi:hypothetical protein
MVLPERRHASRRFDALRSDVGSAAARPTILAGGRGQATGIHIMLRVIPKSTWRRTTQCTM